MMIGSAMFAEEEYANNVIKSALDLGVRHIDTALLYGNQMFNARGIAAAGLKREDVMITSKVGYFPPNCEGKIYPWNDNNVKLGEAESIDLCLKQLETDYIDLLLIHSPFTGAGEFKAALTPHFFAWGHEVGRDFVGVPVSPFKTIDGDDMRELMCEARLERQRKMGINYEEIYEI